MGKFGKILAIDDNEDILFSLKLLLKKHFELIHTEINPDRIPGLLEQGSFDVILLDMNFTRDMIGGQEGFYWLEKILEIDPSSVVIFIIGLLFSKYLSTSNYGPKFSLHWCKSCQSLPPIWY